MRRSPNMKCIYNATPGPFETPTNAATCLTQPPRRGECGSGVNHQVAFLNSFHSFLVVSTNLKNVSILFTANTPTRRRQDRGHNPEQRTPGYGAEKNEERSQEGSRVC